MEITYKHKEHTNLNKAVEATFTVMRRPTTLRFQLTGQHSL